MSQFQQITAARREIRRYEQRAKRASEKAEYLARWDKELAEIQQNAILTYALEVADRTAAAALHIQH